MKKIIIIILFSYAFNLTAQDKQSSISKSKSYIHLSTYLKLVKIKKEEIPVSNYLVRKKDTFVKIPNNFLPKYGAPYEQKDSTFLEIYKDIVYKKHSKDTVKKRKLYMKLWKAPVKVYFSKSVDERYKKTIKRLAAIVNKEVDSLNISIVNDLEQSNYIVYQINENNKYKYSNNLQKNKYIDYYNYWKKSRIYDTKLEINTTKFKNKAVNVNYLIQSFIKSLGHFNTTTKVPCKSVFSKCNSEKKRFRKQDLEILKYHYSYGICKFTDLNTFEKNHSNAIKYHESTGKILHFLHTN